MAKAKSIAQVLEQMDNLVKLAKDDPESEESRNAAMQVINLMDEHELVCIPKADVERAKKVIEGAQGLMRKAKAEKNKAMLMGAVAGYMFAGR